MSMHFNNQYCQKHDGAKSDHIRNSESDVGDCISASSSIPAPPTCTQDVFVTDSDQSDSEENDLDKSLAVYSLQSKVTNTLILFVKY